jgi:hypothetical protein
MVAQYRGSQAGGSYSVGAEPPIVAWTVVRGDTASFRVFVYDDDGDDLDLATWTLAMDIERQYYDGNGEATTSEIILSLTPAITGEDEETGSFTVSLLSEESEILETDDAFDIQISDASRVWTLARGTMKIIEDITAQPSES